MTRTAMSSVPMSLSSAPMSFVRTAILAGSVGLLLSGCLGATDDRPINTLGAAQPEQLAPVADAPVNQNNLPPLPGQTELPTYDGGGPQPLQTADAGGSFTTVNAPGMAGPPGGRDLAGGLSIEKLLGRWTITSGGMECALNLTYTQKLDTTRYRASIPGCAITGLGEVASWQIVGNQVQLFDEGGRIVAALALSGNRFVGTSSGGVGISMA